MRSTSTSQRSPGRIQSGGFRASPTPAGVPVTMTSPGSQVIASLRVETSVATSKIRSSVEASCTT